MRSRKRGHDGHQWEPESVHGGIRPGGGKWSNRLERCAVCSARRQRRMTWDSGGELQNDLIDATAPDPLTQCEGVRV